MFDELDDYDWEEVFGYAGEVGEDEWHPYNQDVPGAIPLSENPASTKPFGREEVTEIISMREGENDEADWLICGKLSDGRYFSIEAGCDYTGWDCRSGGHATVAMDLDELIRMGMSPQARRRLGLKMTP